MARSTKRLSRRVLLVLTTTSNRREALKLAEGAVAGKLAACANVVPSITSIFRWKGQVHRSPEVLLIMKTSTRRYPALAKFIRSKHSYEVPEIIALSVGRGSHPYLEWVQKETATDRGPMATH